MQEGPPRTTAHQARARQGISRGRGPPDMGADHARHGTGVSARGGRPSPRSAGRYKDASMREEQARTRQATARRRVAQSALE